MSTTRIESRRVCRSLIFILSAKFLAGLASYAQAPSGVQNASGLRLVVANDNTCPTLRIILPGHPDTDRTIEVLFPEHVTVRKQGETEAKHLYLFQPGLHGDRPGWQHVGQSLEYEKELSVPHISVRWIRVLHEATLHVELVHIKHWNGVYDAIAEVQLVITGLGNLWRFGCRCSTKSR